MTLNIEMIIRRVAGSFILLSLLLGVTASPLFQSENWLWFTAFVGFNLLQSSFSGFCPLEKMLQFYAKKMAVNPQN